MAKLSNKDIIASLKEMTMLEIKSLIEEIEKEFNISAAAPVVAAAPSAASENKEPSVVTVFLKEVGPNKVAVIKAVREIVGLGLMEAKKLVDTAPCKVKEDVKYEDGEKIKKQLEDVKAVVELK